MEQPTDFVRSEGEYSFKTLDIPSEIVYNTTE